MDLSFPHYFYHPCNIATVFFVVDDIVFIDIFENESKKRIRPHFQKIRHESWPTKLERYSTNSNNFSVLGRLGAFNGKLDSTLAGSDRGTNLKVGAGVQYDLSPKTSVRADWERYRFDALGSKSNTDLYSVGLNYRF